MDTKVKTIEVVKVSGYVFAAGLGLLLYNKISSNSIVPRNAVSIITILTLISGGMFVASAYKQYQFNKSK